MSVGVKIFAVGIQHFQAPGGATPAPARRRSSAAARGASRSRAESSRARRAAARPPARRRPRRRRPRPRARRAGRARRPARGGARRRGVRARRARARTRPRERRARALRASNDARRRVRPRRVTSSSQSLSSRGAGAGSSAPPPPPPRHACRAHVSVAVGCFWSRSAAYEVASASTTAVTSTRESVYPTTTSCGLLDKSFIVEGLEGRPSRAPRRARARAEPSSSSFDSFLRIAHGSKPRSASPHDGVVRVRRRLRGCGLRRGRPGVDWVR